MDVDLAAKILKSLYSDIDGYNISSQARKKAALEDKALTYGEVMPEQFQKILSLTSPQKGEVFYDLGSGLGKPTLLASLFFDFSRATGIELLGDLYEASTLALRRFEKEIRPTLGTEKKDQKINFINQNFLDYDLTDADVIFTHSTCFSLETMDNLAKKLAVTKPGTRLITVTKTIESPFFQQLRNGEYFMNWGRATIYTYKKIA